MACMSTSRMRNSGSSSWSRARCITGRTPSLARFHLRCPVTQSPFFDYLRKLHGIFGNANPIHLIQDLCSAHRRAQVKATADQLGIILHFIPPGLIDEFQPLYRLVLGASKATARHLFQQTFWEDPHPCLIASRPLPR
jgi:hypothetical protein